MKRVKQFLEDFFIKEAEVINKKRFPNLEDYNTTLNEYFLFLVDSLQGATGHLPLNELRSEAQYQRLKKHPASIPRKLFKISEYKHEKRGKVWMAYVSKENPINDIMTLNDIILIFEENTVLKICGFLLYTNYSEFGKIDLPYRWDNLNGYRDLNFESLEGPIHIERYLEPSDIQDSLKLYLENK